MPAKSVKSESDGFTAEERAAIKERAAELRAEGKKGAKKADGLRWPVNVLDDTYALVGDGSRPTGGIGQAGPDSPYTGMLLAYRGQDRS